MHPKKKKKRRTIYILHSKVRLWLGGLCEFHYFISSGTDRNRNMFLTNVLLKKAKSKEIMVQLQSVVSGHTFNKIRERLGDKLEVIRFDPWIQMQCLYKEKKKVRSM
ncbi:unnamed protein product [Phaedon cochleariae]|uniref:Large ribosomal subunit protein bL33m n=1 Tax=Phaedon cochleariae TaxID=80249 RepID=A0A9P0DFH6_PHACE|nr:unnamed protein product [Phaedon cochleariae]